MTHPRPRRGIVAASLTALALTLAACSADDAATDASADASSGTESATESGTDATGAEEVTVEDNHGAVTVSVPPQTVVATDNRNQGDAAKAAEDSKRFGAIIKKRRITGD